ncbi:MAG: cupin domain-containing protein [Planctomycetota bacterium]|nr:cupin domain-containing protein [Planctomycetota bacterium]
MSAGLRVVRPGEETPLWWLGARIDYLSFGEDSADRYCLARSETERGAGPPPHIQRREDEGFYILKGGATFTAGGRSVRAREGWFINIPRGMTHSFVTDADADTAMLILNAPAGFDRFQREAGRPIKEPAAPIEKARREDFDRMAALAPNYGIDLSPSAADATADSALTVRGPDDGVCLSVAGDRYRILADGSETNGAYALIDALVPPGGGPPMHTHSREHEAFYILDGEITFRTPDRVETAEPGAFVAVAPGVWHGFRNEGDRDARMLILLAPAGFEAYFQTVGRALADAKSRPAPPTGPEIEQMLALGSAYGIEFMPH